MKFKLGKIVRVFFCVLPLEVSFCILPLFFSERSWPWFFFLCFSSFNCRRFFNEAPRKIEASTKGFRLKNISWCFNGWGAQKLAHFSMFLGLSLMIERCVSSALWVLSAKKSSHSASSSKNQPQTCVNELVGKSILQKALICHQYVTNPLKYWMGVSTLEEPKDYWKWFSLRGTQLQKNIPWNDILIFLFFYSNSYISHRIMAVSWISHGTLRSPWPSPPSTRRPCTVLVPVASWRYILK